MSTTAIDHGRVRHFAGKVMGDLAGVTASALVIIGDRLGLFRALDEGGPASSAELAARAGVAERYVREWLYGLHAAGYLELDRERSRFSLPAEHAEVLAREAAPFFLAGSAQALQGALGVVDELTEAFRSGGGVPQAAYPDDMTEGIRRGSAPWYEHQLLQQWIPAADGLRAKLDVGVRYADVGCGAGHAVITLATQFPCSTFVGYDAFEGAIDQARRAAQQAGVSDRVRFELLDATSGIPERYGVISTFDVIHDATDPVGVLRAIKRGLEPDGTYLMLEWRCADDPAENVGPFSTMLYGLSLMYCMLPRSRTAAPAWECAAARPRRCGSCAPTQASPACASYRSTAPSTSATRSNPNDAYARARFSWIQPASAEQTWSCCATLIPPAIR